VKVNSTLTIWNETETREMFAICDELGVPLIFDLVVTPRDDGDRAPLALAASAEGIRALLRLQTERYEAQAAAVSGPLAQSPNAPPPPLKHCGAGSSGVAVDPYGNVYPCVAWRRAAGNLHETRIATMWRSSFDDVREQTVAAAGVVRAHPLGPVLNFCPGLAVTLTGSATTVAPENLRVAEIISQPA
jgi:MoaA/NifB/PqqE/SkfB family radical SAM enzyme